MTMPIKGLLFDKDGTLFHYGGTWSVWCGQVLDDLCAGDLVLKSELARACGYDLVTKEFVAGSVVVNATAAEVNACWAALLPDMSEEDVDVVAVRHLENLPSLPVCDLPAFFKRLRDAGYKLGIATNDYEAGAMKQMKDVGATHLLDFICGYDSGHGGKPGPGMIFGFCQATGLTPDQVAMVGDSTHDLAAGRAAKAGVTVGVLTGPATAQDIAHLADVICPDVTHLPEALSQS